MLDFKYKKNITGTLYEIFISQPWPWRLNTFKCFFVPLNTLLRWVTQDKPGFIGWVHCALLNSDRYVFESITLSGSFFVLYTSEILNLKMFVKILLVSLRVSLQCLFSIFYFRTPRPNFFKPTIKISLRMHSLLKWRYIIHYALVLLKIILEVLNITFIDRSLLITLNVAFTVK